MQSVKLELIKMIADIQNEELLGKIRQFLKVETSIQYQASSLNLEETELLLKINEGLPDDIQSRYNTLLTKSVQGLLTDDEHEELLQIVPMDEAKNVERLEYLIRLANLWNITVDEVMEKLGITTPLYRV